MKIPVKGSFTGIFIYNYDFWNIYIPTISNINHDLSANYRLL